MLLDASLFSRIIKYVDLASYKKFLKYDTDELIIGRATSLNGDLIKIVSTKKVVNAPKRLEDGSLRKFVSLSGGFKIYEVPAGLTFKELLDESFKTGEYPAIFPFYLEGTVGGFIATNGSGFGSYKYGFVNFNVQIHSLENRDIAKMSFVAYPEVIEIDQEVDYAWTGLIVDGKPRFYVPTLYSDLLPSTVQKSVLDTKDVVNQYIQNVYKSMIRPNGIPIILQFLNNSIYEKINNELKSLNMIFLNIVRFNSPNKRIIVYGSIDEDKLSEIVNYLKGNLDYVVPYPSLLELDEFRKELLKGYKESKLKTGKQFSKSIKILEEAGKCVNCGLCLNSCAAFTITGNILYSPVGKFNKVVKGSSLNLFYDFEPCIGCKVCEASCPEGIKISEVTEVLPQFSKNKVKVDKVALTPMPSELVTKYEEMLENMYKSHPVYALFIGCAWNYDENGVLGFLEFLRNDGDKVPSARVKIINGMCCGFEDYIEGNIENAKKFVEAIDRERERLGAQRIYFLCPEGYYVYTKLGGKAGILAYEIIKDHIKGRVHIGCWMQKLGYNQGDVIGCPANYLIDYMGNVVPLERKPDIFTTCPFATWKYGATSVYGYFLKTSTAQIQKSFEVVEEANMDKLLIEISIKSLADAINDSADDIAFRVSSWKLGGREYFIQLAIPIFRKYFSNSLREKYLNNKQIKDYLNKNVQVEHLLSVKAQQIYEYLNALQIEGYILEFRNRIANSVKLDYNARDIVEQQEFIEALSIILRKGITADLIENVLREVGFS
ncbi:MAG: 4Fe-4S dicluster domain-containing protein [Sulfolobaceae archaeon]|nr:4Fe-4S dicluster domain-containing protein [Sulfolobaceae archaeon]